MIEVAMKIMKVEANKDDVGGGGFGDGGGVRKIGGIMKIGNNENWRNNENCQKCKKGRFA